MKQKIIGIILLVVSLGCLAYSGIELYKYYTENNNNEQIVEELKTEVVNNPVYIENNEVIPVEEDEPYVNPYVDLQAENSDLVGWITIPGTRIDYPVMQTPNNEQYYIHRDFYHNYSSPGMIFCRGAADLEKPSQNITMYGHHMRIGTMFHDLTRYQDEEFYQMHRYIQFNTSYRPGTYEVVAAFESSTTDFNFWDFIDSDSKNGISAEEFIANFQGRTPYETTEVSPEDEFITLITCNYHRSNGRYIVIARRVQ